MNSTSMNWSARYRAAFEVCRPRVTPLQSDILNALYHAPEQRLTAGLIASFLQRNVIEVNGAFGRLGHNMYDLLGEHPEGRADGTYQWFQLLAEGESTPAGFFWNLWPQVASAMEAVEMVVPLPALPGDPEPERFYEGNGHRVIILRYERNRAARRQCVEIFGCQCVICGFDFGAVYGPIAADYIQVHHLERLSEADGVREVDPRRDLRPVCANCHAVLHLRTPPYTVEEVKTFVRKYCFSGR